MANFTGTTGDDNLTGTTGADIIEGLTGNDSITGDAGDDTINSGLGTDTVNGGTGNDVLIVDYSANTYTGSDSGIFSSNTGGAESSGSFFAYNKSSYSFDQVNFSNINLFQINGTAVNDDISTGIGNDTIIGGAGDDSITSGAGDDSITSGAGNDSMTGGDGNDTYVVDTASDIVSETSDLNAGTDTVKSFVTYTLSTNVENLTLDGATAINGNGNSLNNTILGNTAANTINGATGNDALKGGTGNDTYIVNAGDTVTEDSTLATEIDTVRSSVTHTLSTNVENLTLTGINPINGTGNSLNNAIVGNTFANVLDGGVAGNDAMTGGIGNDTYVVDTVGDTVSETSITATEIDTVQSGVTYTLGSNVENLTLTGATAINGTGNALNNSITGNTASNTLTGGAGTDTLIGGAGDDVYLVDSPTDIITEAASLGTDRVDSSVTYILGSELENLTLTGATAINGTGNALANIITGNTANNTLSGLAGNDTVNGGAGTDTLIGGVGNDVYLVDSATDAITENASEGTDRVDSSVTFTLGSELENLTLTGTAAINGIGNTLNNTISGNTANNTLTGGVGTDTLIGGASDDIYQVDTTTDTITEATNAGIDKVESSVTFLLTNILNLENLTLTGTAAINGNGNYLNNTITGNTANNTFFGGLGTDTLIGGAGDDIYLVDTTPDIITEASGGGTDKVDSSVTYTLGSISNLENLTLTGTNAINGTGNALNNTITGNTANNTLSGDAGNDSMTGNDGNDTMSGGTGNDSMTGGIGDDTYVIDIPTDIITEAANEGTTDKVESSVTYALGNNLENLTLTGTTAINGSGNGSNNTITGNTANNNLSGGDGNDIMIGGDGNDTMTGDAGNDSYEGGVGDDNYVIDLVTEVITEVANAGTDKVESSVTYTLGSNLENLTLTGNSTIDGTGNGSNNAIIGNAGNNILSGLVGDDILTGGAGTDTFLGGTGNDTYVIDVATESITEAASEGTDKVESSFTYTLGSNLENLSLTGTGTIDGTGNALVNSITGNTSNNILSGGLDILNDTLVGGAGNDTYVVDNTIDTLTEVTSQGTDRVDSSVTYTLGNNSNLENLTLTGASAINATGNELNNSITGNTADNTLTGGTGIDTLVGGAGNDIYDVDATGDVINETSTIDIEIDLVKSSVSYSLNSNLEKLTLTGTTEINGTGNTLKNILTGNDASNTLSSGAGNDTIIGGAGNDSLTGGADSDRFIYDTNAVFTAATVGKDILTDFTVGVDKIVLDKTTFSALTSSVDLGSEFAVVNTDADAATASGLIVFSSGTGNLFYNANGTTAGLGSGDQFTTLSGISTVSATDFVLQA